METKAVAHAELKMLPGEGSNGSLEGYLSVFNTAPDSYGDIIAPGAYTDTIADFLRDGFMAVDHSWGYAGGIVGTWRDAREDSKGLFVVGDFHSHPLAQQARTTVQERIAAGKSVGLSIGYETLAYEMRKADQPVRGMFGDTDMVRVLTKLKLYEGSIVGVAAQHEAQATGAKTTQTYADHGSRVLADVQAFLARSVDLNSLRAKEGRVLSAANRSKLEALLESLTGLDPVKAAIEELLTATEPQKAVDIATEFLRFQQSTARLNGVAIPL